MTAPVPARAVATSMGSAIESWLNALYRDLSSSSARVEEQLEAKIAAGDKVSRNDISGLREIAAEFLDSHPIVVGAGVIFSISALKDAEGVLEWWFRNAAGEIEKLDFDLAPEGERFYDYEQLPWFSIAAKTGQQSIAGPYVDYLGFDEYIMTCTVPSYVHGQFIGVTGCDIRIRDLENAFIPFVRRIPGDAAILNGQNRVILGNSGRFIVGERVKTEPEGFCFIPLDVPNLNLRLICAAE
jgi:hypothetical protein